MAKIQRIEVYRVELPLHEGRYAWSGGHAVEVFDATVVAMRSEEGATGWGEVCPLGPAYLPAFAEGARAGLARLAPALLGVDAADLGQLNARMDAELKGHPYVKSPLDMAAWDLLGQQAGLPVCRLLGGRYGESFPLYRAISQAAPEAMAASVAEYRRQGYRKFQLKVGGEVEADVARIHAAAARLEPGDVLIADANTGWNQHQALRVARAVRDLDVYLEQPCPSYAACLAVRQHTNLPFVLDEVVDRVETVLQVAADRAADVINLKISKVGGLTRARQIRDLCVTLGIGLTIEDTWGGDIVTAAIAHLAHSTPPESLFTTTDFNSYVTVSIAENAPQRQAGRMAAPLTPGLGIRPRPEALGKPVFSVGYRHGIGGAGQATP